MSTLGNYLPKAVLTSTPTICVLSRNIKYIRVFVSGNLQFLEVKFSIYLNRHVFVMKNNAMLTVLIRFPLMR